MIRIYVVSLIPKNFRKSQVHILVSVKSFSNLINGIKEENKTWFKKQSKNEREDGSEIHF